MTKIFDLVAFFAIRKRKTNSKNHIFPACRNFKKKFWGECYEHKWNFKPKISSIFHFWPVSWTLTCTQKKEYSDSVLKLLEFFYVLSDFGAYWCLAAIPFAISLSCWICWLPWCQPPIQKFLRDRTLNGNSHGVCI